MPVRKAATFAAVLFALTVPATGSAQSDGLSIHAFGQLGTAVALRDLNTSGTATVKSPAIAFGGGVGVQFNENVALRGYVDYAPTEGEGATNPLLGMALNRTYYGVDARFSFPTEKGIVPFFGLGAGGTSVNSADDDAYSHDAFTGKGLFGVGYMTSEESPLEYFAQGSAYLYNYKALTFDRTQVDMLFSVGVKYSFMR